MSKNGKRYGVCENFDNCSNAKNRKIIELDELDDFLCPECHSELHEVENKGGNKSKLIAIIVAAAVVLGGAGTAGYMYLKPQSKVENSGDGGGKTPVDTTIGGKSDSTTTPKPEKPVESYGKVNLGYAIYEGPLTNGKPNGVGGTLTFTRYYSIDLKKAPAEYVEVDRGDKMVNVKFVNGKVRQGEIHFADGTRRWVNI